MRYVHKKYKDVKYPVLKKPGRKPKEITKDERRVIIETYKEYLVGATIIKLGDYSILAPKKLKY